MGFKVIVSNVQDDKGKVYPYGSEVEKTGFENWDNMIKSGLIEEYVVSEKAEKEPEKVVVSKKTKESKK